MRERERERRKRENTKGQSKEGGRGS